MTPKNESAFKNSFVALGVLDAQSSWTGDYIGVLFDIFFQYYFECTLFIK